VAAAAARAAAWALAGRQWQWAGASFKAERGDSRLAGAARRMDPLVEGEAHCAAEGCGRLDFLPFACDACGKLLCLSHRLYEAHECVRSGASETVVCPLCAQAVRLVRGEDPNVTHARHVSSGQCVADNYKRVHKKPRCACKGCKESLTLTNRVTCKACGRITCMRHRMPESHACGTHQRSKQRLATAARSATARLSAGAARLTAGASRNRTARAQAGGPASTPAGAERCPQCGATFGDVHALIAHVEARHPGGGKRKKDGSCAVQ